MSRKDSPRDATGAPAALRFMAAFDERLKHATGPEQDLSLELADLAAAWAPHGIGIGPVEQAVAAYTARWDQLCEGRRERFGDDPALFNAVPLVTTERKAVYVSLAEAMIAAATPPESDDLVQARTRLTDLEQELSAGTEAINQAVADRDLDRIDGLRTRIQLELPKELSQARLQLLDLEMVRRASAEAAGDRLRELESGAVLSARKARDAAHQQVIDAENNLALALARSDLSRRVCDQLTGLTDPDTSVGAMEVERERLVADAAADDARRFRQFAGLTS